LFEVQGRHQRLLELFVGILLEIHCFHNYRCLVSTAAKIRLFPRISKDIRDYYPFVSVSQRTREASGEPSLLELFRAEAVFRAKPKERARRVIPYLLYNMNSAGPGGSGGLPAAPPGREGLFFYETDAVGRCGPPRPIQNKYGASFRDPRQCAPIVLW
jgi:hypothetical protein